MSRLLSIVGWLLAFAAAFVVPVLVFSWVLFGRTDAGGMCLELFLIGVVGLGGRQLFRKHRAVWGGAITHPHASGRRHTLVHSLRTEAGVFDVRLVWSVVNPAHDASKALVAALGEVLPSTITRQELDQARAALVTRFAKEGVTVLELALA